MHQNDKFPSLYIVDHPLVLDCLTRLRDVNCDKRMFRACLHDISLLMTYEISSDLALKDAKMNTPLVEMTGQRLSKPPVIIPILRAVLGMTSGVEALIPSAATGHIGVYRDEDTKQPVEYLVKLPEVEDRDIYMVDPMLATGNSAVYAMSILEKHGCDPKRVKFMGLIAAPEGVETFSKAYPDTKLYFAALDSHLNEKAYIVPGLGDAGDRMFGTK